MTEHDAAADADQAGRHDVAARIRDRRHELGYSRAELARRAGVDPKTMASVEAADRWPYGSTRAAIEDALGWDRGTIDHIAQGPTTDLVDGTRVLALRLAVAVYGTVLERQNVDVAATQVTLIADIFDRWIRGAA